MEAREATGSPRAGCVAAAAKLRLALVPRVQGGAGHALAGSPERLGVLFGCAVLSRKWSCENSGQLAAISGAWSCSEDAKTARGAGGSAPVVVALDAQVVRLCLKPFSLAFALSFAT